MKKSVLPMSSLSLRLPKADGGMDEVLKTCIERHKTVV
jgi:hypothetical protein